MKREDWPVTESDTRPLIGFHDECAYCRRKIGEQHAVECVVRTRSVVVEMTVRLVLREPEHWTREQVEFHLNGSSVVRRQHPR